MSVSESGILSAGIEILLFDFEKDMYSFFKQRKKRATDVSYLHMTPVTFSSLCHFYEEEYCLKSNKDECFSMFMQRARL